MTCATPGEPMLTMPHPCCGHCTHPMHLHVASGHVTPCWQCRDIELARTVAACL